MVGAVTHIKSNTVADFTGVVTVLDNAGSTQTIAATDLVRPSDWNSAHAQIATLSGNTAGATTISGTNFVIQGGNGLSVSGAQGANAATIVLSAGNYLTTAMASNAVTLSNIRVSAGATSNLLSALTFANSNGVTFGLSASTLTASHNGLTTARASNDAIGLNTAGTNITWTANSAGLSINAGGYAGTGFTSTTAPGAAITATQNTAGLLLAVPAFLTTAQPVGAYLTTARASNDAVGLNTAQSNVTWTVNSSGLSLDARGYAGTGTTFNGANVSGSLTVNSNGVQVSLSANAAGGTPVASASNGSFSFTTLAFSNANNVTFGTSAGSIITASVAPPGAAAEQNAINLLGANTSGATTATGSTIGLSGVGVTLSGTNNSQVVISAPATSSLSATGQVSISVNGSTISIGVGRTLSQAVLAPLAGYGGPLPFAQSSASLGQNSLYIYPVNIEDYYTFDHIRMPVLVTNSSSAASSGQKGQTYLFGVYTRNNSTQISRLYSTSYTMAASYSSNLSWALSMITALSNSSSYNTVSASSAGLNLSASLHGPRELIMPFSTLLAPGEYFFAVAASTSAAGTAGNVLNISNLAVAYQTYNRPGLSTNATSPGFFGLAEMGTYSTTTGALPGTINNTQINQLGSVPILFAITGTV